jgi:glycine/D-amino acid oxidase-like deaminating enzyme
VTPPADVAIVGGGPIGAACARELALSGRRVVVVEQGGDRGQAWKAAAGMLAPQIETGPEDPALELGLAGRELYTSLAPALLERTGIDIGLWREGIAWVAADETEAGDLRARVAWQRQQSHLSDWLDADEVRARWPWLGRTSGALWAPHEGAVDPQNLVRALLADAEGAGARVVADTAIGIELRGDRAVGVVGENGRYSAGDVILAAGAWAGQVQGVPRPVAVAPVRGPRLCTGTAAICWRVGTKRSLGQRWSTSASIQR